MSKIQTEISEDKFQSVLNDVSLVMEGLKTINFNKQSLGQNSISSFKISHRGMDFLVKNNPQDFPKAIQLWLQIVEQQILHITTEDYEKLKLLAQNPDFAWLDSLFKIKFNPLV